MHVAASLSTLATYLKAAAPGALAAALDGGLFPALLELRRPLHLSPATVAYLQAFVAARRNPVKVRAGNGRGVQGFSAAVACQQASVAARRKVRAGSGRAWIVNGQGLRGFQGLSATVAYLQAFAARSFGYRDIRVHRRRLRHVLHHSAPSLSNQC